MHRAAVVVKRNRLLRVMYLFYAHSSPQALALNHWLSHVYMVWIDSKKTKGYVVNTLLPNSENGRRCLCQRAKPQCTCVANVLHAEYLRCCSRFRICKHLGSYKTKLPKSYQSAVCSRHVSVFVLDTDCQALAQVLWFKVHGSLCRPTTRLEKWRNFT